jgi:hypothetical protein
MKRAVIQMIMLIYGLSAWSQTDRLDSLLNTVVWGDKEMMRLLDPPLWYCYLNGGITRENRTVYTGSEFEDNIVAINGNLYFYHSKGFFVGASGIWYGGPGAGYSTTIASAGINKFLNQKKSLNFRASYSRYFYAYSDSASENPYTNNLSTGISLRNKWIGGRFSLNLLFGKDFGMNFTPGIFSRIPVLRFGRYNKIQLEPELSIFIGSQTVEILNISDLVGKQGSQTTTTTKVTYGLLNTRFYLPVCFYIGDFDLELSYSLKISSIQDENMEYPVSSFFSFSIGYLLPLN